MSGRGTMTSRTTVSPNSMIEWMRVRSSVSITSSSSATSAMASSSDSDTSDPRYWPLCPMSRLARPIRAPDTMRTGENRTRADTRGALNSAARSGCCTAQVLGTASARTKMTTISKTVATTTPQAPNQSRGHDADQGGHHQLADQHQQQHRVEEALGVLDEPEQHLGPAAAVVDQGHGLGPAHPDQAGLGQGQDGRRRQQDDHHDQRTHRRRERDVHRGSTADAEVGQWLRTR